jgi:Arc/MetJ-type ribon-helix-helix transcriptional regulator
MTIQLPPDVEVSIQAAVHNGHFASVDAAMTEAASLLLERLKLEQAQAKPLVANQKTVLEDKPIWEVVAELRKSIPSAEFLKLPKDGAEQLDHYLYGSPKRPTS